ncbi:DUF2201 family putative metallopeptidase [Vreelandella venusta]|uniref:vWA domain-containing protein n=1 Tax=Vreelandella venusta TaxID=44935 RepID=UPI0011704A55|nr:VWA-like domain-containing protein [Halomonas venusta]GEK52391.1 hydrolase [Halomonas venusta]
MTDLAVLEKQLSKAKIQLMNTPDTAFFVTVCLNLSHYFDNAVGTACTNGKFVKYSPAFWQKQNEDQRVGLVLHETLHVVFDHMGRIAERDPRRWNKAADYVINQIIIDRGFKLPEGGLLDSQYREMSAEQVYDLLRPEECIDFPMDIQEPDDPTEHSEAIADILLQASIQSRIAGDKPGTIPGEIEFYINKLLAPKLNLKHQLKRYFNGFSRGDYSYRRISRRYRHVCMPKLYSEAMGHVAIAADSSGSVTDAEFDRIIGEVAGVIKHTKPEKLTMLTFDRQIQTENEVKNLAELSRLKFKGRGGTSIEPVMQWAKDNTPKVLVVFSDGYFRFPQEGTKPKCPILWLIYNNPNFKAPFGKVIHFDME